MGKEHFQIKRPLTQFAYSTYLLRIICLDVAIVNHQMLKYHDALRDVIHHAL